MLTAILDKANWFDFCRVKMTYSVDDAFKEDDQIERELHIFISLYQTSNTDRLSKCEFAVKQYLWSNLQVKSLYLQVTHLEILRQSYI